VVTVCKPVYIHIPMLRANGSIKLSLDHIIICFSHEPEVTYPVGSRLLWSVLAEIDKHNSDRYNLAQMVVFYPSTRQRNVTLVPWQKIGSLPFGKNFGLEIHALLDAFWELEDHEEARYCPFPQFE
jgi:hypothetical protein